MKWVPILMALLYISLCNPVATASSNVFIIDPLFDPTQRFQYDDGKYLVLSRQGSYLQFVRPSDAYTYSGVAGDDLAGPSFIAFNVTLVNARFTSFFPSATQINQMLSSSNSSVREILRGPISGIYGKIPDLRILPADYFDFITTSFFSTTDQFENASEILRQQEATDIENLMMVARRVVWVDTSPSLDFIQIDTSKATVILNGLEYNRISGQWNVGFDHDILNLGFEVIDYPAFAKVEFFQREFQDSVRAFDQNSSLVKSHLEVQEVTIAGSGSRFSDGSLIPLTKDARVPVDPLPPQPVFPIEFTSPSLSVSIAPSVVGIALAISYASTSTISKPAFSKADVGSEKTEARVGLTSMENIREKNRY